MWQEKKERKPFSVEELSEIKERAGELVECGADSRYKRAYASLAVAAGKLLVLLEQVEDDED